MSNGNGNGLAAQVKALLEELVDLKSGIPSHQHLDSSGEKWRCTSPYCDRLEGVDQPCLGPHEQAHGDANKYRRTYA